VDRPSRTPSTLALHAERLGQGPAIALIHGFTQTSRCWGPITTDLATDHELVLVDAPGHGGSAAVDADLVGGGRLIAESGGAATYLGYSMGGRFVLHAALERPDLVRGLVLVGATAGIDDETERATRRAEDEARARRIEQIGVEAFVGEWLQLPLFTGLTAERACRDERLVNTVNGLASSLRLAGTGTQIPTWDRLHELAMPVLVVAGVLDEKFTELGERMATAIGANATFAPVDGAGHTAHLEQPERFLSTLRTWLAEHGL
jgi:2-succinyl-6-hydroxy-2,4-cyclohexadiene-1-carboxylate synthase